MNVLFPLSIAIVIAVCKEIDHRSHLQQYDFWKMRNGSPPFSGTKIISSPNSPETEKFNM